MKKIIVLLGSTASGKTKLAVNLAKKFKGEIVSADSRQVYRGLDIGTGKDLSEYKIKKSRKQESLPDGALAKAGKKAIRYHLIDIVSPKKQFTVADFQRLATNAIKQIIKKGSVPMIVGGTGLYIDALTQGFSIPPKANAKLQQRLNKLSLTKLLSRLKKVDLKTYKIIDKKNRRRVQRALEIYYVSGQAKSTQPSNPTSPYEVLYIGIKIPKEKLDKKIEQRLSSRLRQGMIKEVRDLHKKGLSWKRMEALGLEYRYLARFLQGKIDREELEDQLGRAIKKYAKRQRTWFKRNKKIQWVTTNREAGTLIRQFLLK